eukprot:6489554-Amphidinium_carterae.1
MEAKRQSYLLKLTVLSGRRTVVAASGYLKVGDVLARCLRRLGLLVDATLELWQGSERVPDDNTCVSLCERLAWHPAAPGHKMCMRCFGEVLPGTMVSDSDR